MQFIFCLNCLLTNPWIYGIIAARQWPKRAVFYFVNPLGNFCAIAQIFAQGPGSHLCNCTNFFACPSIEPENYTLHSSKSQEEILKNLHKNFFSQNSFFVLTSQHFSAIIINVRSKGTQETYYEKVKKSRKKDLTNQTTCGIIKEKKGKIPVNKRRKKLKKGLDKLQKRCYNKNIKGCDRTQERKC